MAEAQDKPSAGADQSGCQIDQLLDHRANAAALGRVADRGELAEQPHLADGPKDVVGKTTQGHDQGIGGKFATRQPFEIKIGFELAMELLRGGMVPIQGDHLLGLQVEVGPPAFQGDVRGEPHLSVPVGGPFGHAHYPLAGVACTVHLHGFVDHQQADSLAGPGRGDRAFAEHPVAPGQLVAVARVPLDDEAHLFGSGEHLPRFHRVVGRVQPDQDLLLNEHMRRLDHSLDERHESRLTVLAARPQFDFQAPALHAQVGGDGRIAVKVLVGAAYPFLAGVRVVLGEHVHVQGHKAIGVARDLDAELLEHGLRTARDQWDQAVGGSLVQSLPQTLGRGDATDAQGLLEIVVAAHAGDGLEIALAQAQQPQVAAQDIDVGDLPVAPTQSTHLPAQVAVAVDTGANQAQAGVAGVKFAVALLDDQSLHVFTCQVSFFDRYILINFYLNFNILIV